MKDNFENNDVQYQERENPEEEIRIALSVDEVVNTWDLNFAANEYLDISKTIRDLCTEKNRLEKIMQFQNETFPKDGQQLSLFETEQMQKCEDNYRFICKRLEETINYFHFFEKNYSKQIYQVRDIGQREMGRRALERYKKMREEKIAQRRAEDIAKATALKKENPPQQNTPAPTPAPDVANTTRKKQNFGVLDKIKTIFASIPFSVLGLLEFYLVYLATSFAILLVIYILSKIPILGALVKLFFRWRQDSPEIFALLAAALIAYSVVTKTINRITQKAETTKMSFMLTGSCLTVLNVIFLLVNIISKGSALSILANIYLAVAGIIMFFKANQK